MNFSQYQRAPVLSAAITSLTYCVMSCVCVCVFLPGYIVFSGVRRSNGVQGLRIIVQSDKSPEYVESRVELFLHKMKVHFSHFAIILTQLCI